MILSQVGHTDDIRRTNNKMFENKTVDAPGHEASCIISFVISGAVHNTVYRIQVNHYIRWGPFAPLKINIEIPRKRRLEH